MTVNARQQAPLSSHPLFVALVALWFAALFGLGSLVLQVSLLERGVHALHLDQLVPAAAPPLGTTARLLVAVLFALAGGAIGALIAVIARRSRPRPTVARSATAATGSGAPRAAVTPLPDDRAVTGTDLGDDNDDLARLDAAREDTPRRRRSLIPQDTPASGASILNLDDLHALDPSLLPDSLASAASQRDDDFWSEVVHTPPAAAAAETALTESAPAQPAAMDRQPPESRPVTAEDSAPVAEFAPAQPSPDVAEPAIVSTPVPTPVTMAVPPAGGTAAQRLRSAPLESLGVVELVERFAIALATRQSAASPEPTDEPAAVATTASPAAEPWPAPDAAANGAAAPFGSPHPQPQDFSRPFDMPAMLRSPLAGRFGEDDEPDDADAPADFSLPPRTLDGSAIALRDLAPEPEAPHEPDAEPAGLAPAAALEEMADGLDDAVADEEFADDTAAPNSPQADRFSSLLAMKPSVRTPSTAPASPLAGADPARLDGTAAPLEPAVSDASLRDALAALQRMSGAA